MIELNVVNFVTIGIIALAFMALMKFIGQKFDIAFLK
jgi:hypothetical protein